MRLPHPPPNATRFFAKPLSGWIECPRCGKLLYFQSAKATRQRSNAEWDSRTGRIKCPSGGNSGCGLVLVLGIIAWPVQGGAPRRTAPRDQVPDERQLAQMRRMDGGGAGWWMPKAMARVAFRPEDTNITASCTCKALEDGRLSFVAGCPIHSTPDEDEDTEEA